MTPLDRRREDHTRELLVMALVVAVPLWADRMRGWMTVEAAMARARACAQLIAEKGDLVLFRSKTPGETERVFNALAEGIAIASFAPGGITAFGMHWENHPEPDRHAHMGTVAAREEYL